MYNKSSSNRMRISKVTAYQYFVLFVSCIVALIAVLCSDSPTSNILSMWMLTFVAILLVKFDLFHPYFWFSLFFTLYSTANAILWNIGIREGHYTKEQILYPVFSLAIVLFIVGPSKINNEETFKNFQEMNSKTDFIEMFVKVLIIMTLLFSIILRLRGYVSKIQMRSEGDLFYRYGVLVARFLTFFVLVQATNGYLKKDKLPWKTLVACGLTTLIFTLFTSERDVVFRFGYSIALLLVALKIMKPKHLLFAFPIGVGAMAASVAVKHYFLRGILNSGTGNIIYDFLTSDFTAAGRNLQYLLDMPWTKGHLGWKTYFTELLKPLLIGIRTINPDYWFNYEVHKGSFKGYAFTLVGTGYAIGGVIGIITIFITVGLITRFFYRKSTFNIYWFAAYIYISSTIVFSFRQSLQTITNSMVKHVGLAVLICWFVSRYSITFGNHGTSKSIRADLKSSTGVINEKQKSSD